MTIPPCAWTKAGSRHFAVANALEYLVATAWAKRQLSGPFSRLDQDSNFFVGAEGGACQIVGPDERDRG